MKILKKLESLSFVLFVIFAIFGVYCATIIIHEVMHKNDYKEFVKQDYICAFVWPDSINYLWSNKGLAGYYQMLEYDKSRAIEMYAVETKTEIKAYIVSISMLIILGVVLNFVIRDRLKSRLRKDILKELNVKEEDYTYG